MAPKIANNSVQKRGVSPQPKVIREPPGMTLLRRGPSREPLVPVEGVQKRQTCGSSSNSHCPDAVEQMTAFVAQDDEDDILVAETQDGHVEDNKKLDERIPETLEEVLRAGSRLNWADTEDGEVMEMSLEDLDRQEEVSPVLGNKNKGPRKNGDKVEKEQAMSAVLEGIMLDIEREMEKLGNVPFGLKTTTREKISEQENEFEGAEKTKRSTAKAETYIRRSN
ncbi:hypothetical protein HK098_000282 [Nowakowskiella sp. JEL0407]|nr:hypothetical protein HK098_000282 [Nowakowskiella sp. JEL0407]